MYHNRYLRKIFGPERDEETGSSRELRNEDILSFTEYYYGDQIEDGAMGVVRHEWKK
jgi:hypothetical protein